MASVMVDEIRLRGPRPPPRRRWLVGVWTSAVWVAIATDRPLAPSASRGTVAREIDYNGRVPSAPGQPSWRSRLVKPFVLVVVVGGLSTFGAYAERQATTPTDDACMTMLNYHQSALGEEDGSDAWDRLRYFETRLDKTTAPEAVAIREYLAYDALYRGAGLAPNELLLETDDIGLLGRTGTGHRLLMRAAKACTDLGHSELQEYLNDDTRPTTTTTTTTSSSG
jgi:hypothetical protein